MAVEIVDRICLPEGVRVDLIEFSVNQHQLVEDITYSWVCHDLCSYSLPRVCEVNPVRSRALAASGHAALNRSPSWSRAFGLKSKKPARTPSSTSRTCGSLGRRSASSGAAASHWATWSTTS